MNPKLLKVAIHEFKAVFLKKSFIISILSLPLFIAMMVTLGFIKIANRTDIRPVGIVDKSVVYKDLYSSSLKEEIPFIPFQTAELAREALIQNKIQAYFIIPRIESSDPGSPVSKIESVSIAPPGANVTRQFYDYLRMKRIAHFPPSIIHRAVRGSQIITQTLDGKREWGSDPSINQILPVFAVLAVIFLVVLSSSSLMQAVVKEKENRTIEILLTSLSPYQLIAGKIAGIIAAGLIMCISWIIFGAIAIYIGGQYLGIQWFQTLTPDFQLIVGIVGIAVPNYIMFGALMVAVSSTVAEMKEGASITSQFLFIQMIPFFFVQRLVEDPTSVLSVLLNIFPPTALMSYAFRNMFIVVPFWQVGISVAVSALFAFASIKLAAYAFHLGVLRYGKSFSWAIFINAIKSYSTGKRGGGA